MEYIAVYRREDDPDLDGVPVALFRDGALMQSWHKTTDGVHNREMVIGSVELPDTVAYSPSVADHYARPEAAPADEAAFSQMVAEAKARLTREHMQRAAEAQAWRELNADLTPMQPMPETPEPEPLPEPTPDPILTPDTEPPAVPVAPIVSTVDTTEAGVTTLDERSGSVVPDEESPPVDSSTPADGD